MATISVKKSYKDGHVSVRVALKGRGWPGDSVKVEGDTDITSAQARGLAAALVAEADRADAKVAAKEAAEARRKKWHDREVAAGRIKVISAQSFFGRSSPSR